MAVYHLIWSFRAGQNRAFRSRSEWTVVGTLLLTFGHNAGAVREVNGAVDDKRRGEGGGTGGSAMPVM